MLIVIDKERIQEDFWHLGCTRRLSAYYELPHKQIKKILKALSIDYNKKQKEKHVAN